MKTEVDSSVAIMQSERDAIQKLVAHVSSTRQAMEEIVVCVEQVYCSLNAIVNINHGKEGFGLQEALVETILKSLEEDFYNL
jgi:hypothetical protein